MTASIGPKGQITIATNGAQVAEQPQQTVFQPLRQGESRFDSFSPQQLAHKIADVKKKFRREEDTVRKLEGEVVNARNAYDQASRNANPGFFRKAFRFFSSNSLTQYNTNQTTNQIAAKQDGQIVDTKDAELESARSRLSKLETELKSLENLQNEQETNVY